VADADVVILTALELEAAPFLSLIESPNFQRSEHRTYIAGVAEGDNGEKVQVVVWPIGGMGNVRSGVATHQAITIWNPSYIVLSGITGGFRKEGLLLGDVIVPEQVVGYEPGKVLSDTVQSRFDVYLPSTPFLSAAHVSARENWWRSVSTSRPGGRDEIPRAHFGVLASGEKVVASQNWTRRFVDIWPRAVGVEMEALGVATAAYAVGEAPGTGVVKAISDWADESKSDDWQAYAANVAAAFVMAVVRNLKITKERLQPQIDGSPLSTHAERRLKEGWGKKKVQLCRRLDPREQRELADCCEINPSYKDSFPEAGYCSAVWDYLQRRGKLSGLPEILKDCLDRPDLVDLVLDLE
jgi:adenosylhomocysteine nucleosidase